MKKYNLKLEHRKAYKFVLNSFFASFFFIILFLNVNSIYAFTPTFRANMTLDPSASDVSDINIKGDHFGANMDIDIRGFGEDVGQPPLTTCKADSSGNITGGCKIPSWQISNLIGNLINGEQHVIKAYNHSDNEEWAEATWTYTGANPPLITTTPTYMQLTCSDSEYYKSHKPECDCAFDKGAGQYNQNTYTALGCLPSNLGMVINIILTIAIGLASVISLLRMILGGYEIMTNPAGPDEIKEGQEMITNAVLGLMFIILSIVILRIIGINILQIPGIDSIFGK